MKNNIKLIKSNLRIDAQIELPGSKSESNRALIISALSGPDSQLLNLSSARDTDTMQRLIQSNESELDVLDAGTTMRFLTSYLAVTNQVKTLTGTPRMQKRPIKVLVDALRKIGADISYLNEEGYPPISIKGFTDQKSDKIEVRADISSQYISSLLMSAPILPDGLTINLQGQFISQPYVKMTIAIMKHFGVEVETGEHGFSVKPQQYKTNVFEVESDWSNASYWYSMVAISENGQLFLKGLKSESHQGDSAIAGIMKNFGVESKFVSGGVEISKCPINLPETIDFIDCPDLAQTVSVVCAALGHKCTFTGLQTLKIKETDRVAAIKAEIRKFNADLVELDNEWVLEPSSKEQIASNSLDIYTYDDHRMAMAFAPLALLTNVFFDDKTVVNKSYPGFWDDITRAGITIE